jgi:hypothetical protein
VSVDAGKRYLAVANNDEQIELFDLKAEVAAGTIKAADKLEDVLFLGFDRLGQQIVAVLPYGDVHTWNPSTLKPLRSVVLAGGELHGSRAVVHAAATNRATNVFGFLKRSPSGRDPERRDPNGAPCSSPTTAAAPRSARQNSHDGRTDGHGTGNITRCSVTRQHDYARDWEGEQGSGHHDRIPARARRVR